MASPKLYNGKSCILLDLVHQIPNMYVEKRPTKKVKSTTHSMEIGRGAKLVGCERLCGKVEWRRE
ncbi:hypothetical protein M408DRAFT_230446 [Serendipita vermifera MAFF 305830]|uniref:Uncharacterized protein n=1 Tax=Serendipita vermifera MAFF 305830 TaxID=933852 RepID=A0A0C3AZN0_SERVB|nr:hypothetical protein M408DRAFT_230446 [Serendipita vermifera MAFF 305830]